MPPSNPALTATPPHSALQHTAPPHLLQQAGPAEGQVFLLQGRAAEVCAHQNVEHFVVCAWPL